MFVTAKGTEMPSTRLKKSAKLYDVKLQEELGILPSNIELLLRQYDIDPKGLSKQELVHRIQRQEGNFDCFASATTGECDQVMCLWRKDCLESSNSSAH